MCICIWGHTARLCNAKAYGGQGLRCQCLNDSAVTLIMSHLEGGHMAGQQWIQLRSCPLSLESAWFTYMFKVGECLCTYELLCL